MTYLLLCIIRRTVDLYDEVNYLHISAIFLDVNTSHGWVVRAAAQRVPGRGFESPPQKYFVADILPKGGYTQHSTLQIRVKWEIKYKWIFPNNKKVESDKNYYLF